MGLENKSVALQYVESKRYPSRAPFYPPEKYPEYSGDLLDTENEVYPRIRKLLYSLGLDKENFGTPAWNPFKGLIKPGMHVFIKPNTVVHDHEKKEGNPLSLIVHASVLRPILDYVCVALKNDGRITIGDSQLIFSEFDKAMVVSGISDLLAWYRNHTSVPIRCFDLRINRGARTWLYGKWKRVPVKQDPEGYQFVDLGNASCFAGIDPSRLRIAIANYKNMYKHHSNGKHEYLFPGSVLSSNVVISVAKLKTHRRTAVTLALKNFMGIPALKDSLPHFITGSVEEGGDQYIYPSLRKRIVTRLHDEVQSNPFTPVKFVCAVTKKILWESRRILPFRDNVYEAMWYGNDTLWRTLLDLNRAVLYADEEGKMRDTQQRAFFGLIDGVLAGEREGPLCADCVEAGALLAGFNPVALDAVGATLMGFDTEKIPLIKKALESNTGIPLFSGRKEDIRIIEDLRTSSYEEFLERSHLCFEPHPNWKGHVERTDIPTLPGKSE